MGPPPLIWTVLILSMVSFHYANSANILITVVGISNSQTLVMSRLADIMGERGHNVTILNYKFFNNIKPIKYKFAREIEYQVVQDPEIQSQIEKGFSTHAWEQSENVPLPIEKLRQIFGQIHESCERILNGGELLDSLRSSKFDVVVIHMVDYCTFGLMRVLEIESYVWMSTFFLMDPMAWYSGSPLAQSYVPNMPPPSDPSTGRLGLVDRIRNLFVSTAMLTAFEFGIVRPYTNLFQKYYGREFPSYRTILSETQLYFTLSDPLFEYARPTTENVIDVGGLTMKKPVPLSQEWQKIVDSAPEDGIVIFSLGSVTNTTTMPQSIRMAFLNSFQKFPRHLFIWRFEGSFPEAGSIKNVHLSKWIPQKDLLASPRVKAAIIHGGYNSLTEVTYLGVPVVVMPLFGDQFGNAVRITRQNLGVQLNREDLSEEKITEALTKVLNDQKIRDSATRLGRMIQRRPFPSHQRAIEWLEYLAEFKRIDQFRPASLDMHLFQYLLLDILVLSIGIVITVFLVIKFCLRCACRKCCGGGGKKKSD